MFERLLVCELPMVTLDVQYRMHPFIGEVTSKEFYGGVVTAGVTAADRQLNDVSFPWPDPNKPTLFWHCDGTEVLGGRNGTSHSNPAEAAAVARAVETLITSGAAGSDIGVITMYDAQRTRVRQELSAAATRHSESEKFAQVEVANVDAFQGREKPFIVLSATRCKGTLGHVGKPRRINVALSRARSGMVIIGHTDTLLSSPFWTRQ